jgi:hypothetical protein
LLFEKITGKTRKDEYDYTFLNFLLHFSIGKSRDFIPKNQGDPASSCNEKTE